MTRARRLAVARIGLFTFAALATVAMAVGLAVAGRQCAADACAGSNQEPPRVTDRADRAGPHPEPAFGDTFSPPGLPSPPHTGPGAEDAAPAESTPPHTGPGAEETPPGEETASGEESASGHETASGDETASGQEPASDEKTPGAATPPGDETAPGEETTPGEETAPGGNDPAPEVQPAPVSTSPLDVSGAADYVRAFYADLSQRHFRAAWPRLAADLRGRHGSFDAWKRGFATTLSQSAAKVSATAIGPASAKVSLTLTAVDRDACKREVTRRFAVTWRLDRGHGDEWHAVHAEAKALKPSPAGLIASCSSTE